MGWFCNVATFQCAYANVKRMSVGPLKMCAVHNAIVLIVWTNPLSICLHLHVHIDHIYAHTYTHTPNTFRSLSLSFFITTYSSPCIQRKGLQWKYLKFICGWMDPEYSWMLIWAKMYGARLMRFVLEQFCAECVFVFQCLQYHYKWD